MQIEKNIPLPPVQLSKGEGYPFKMLDVGDSFLVPFKNKAPRDLQKHLACKAYYYGLRYPMKFTTRIVEGGVRVWRVA